MFLLWVFFPIVIMPFKEMFFRSVVIWAILNASVGVNPVCVGVLAVLICKKIFCFLFFVSAVLLILFKSFKLLTDCITSYKSRALETLFLCRCPIRCIFVFRLSCCCFIFCSVSWTLLSPILKILFSSALWIAEKLKVLVTAIILTFAGQGECFFILCWTSWRFCILIKIVF